MISSAIKQFIFRFDISYVFVYIVQCLGLTGEKLVERSVDFVDIAYDEVSPKHYKEEEVCIYIYIYKNAYLHNRDVYEMMQRIKLFHLAYSCKVFKKYENTIS